MNEHDTLPVFFRRDIRGALIHASCKVLCFEVLSLGMYFLITLPFAGIIQEEGYLWLYLLITAAVIFLIGYFTLRPTLRHRKKLLAQLDTMGFPKAESLAEECADTELQYKTVYFLKEYLYFPRIICLIPYGDVVNMTTVYHSTNGVYDGAQLKFKLEGNKKLTVQMKKIRDFRAEHNWFVGQLEDRIAAAHADTQIREDIKR